ncbi:glycosyltransferase [Psychrobacter frigidicola]|uniref:glycosyltransferase n=1 Tax=Psychrobacter frigidicola TaxID=45611 RepID=UPI0019187083|nr:glycosyltransferase [Psychrobacter frigidicola]
MSNEVIKVFVGCDPNNCDLEQMMVLDYSLHKHTSAPVEVVWMQLSRDPNSYWYSNPETGEGWNTTKWATPFSGFRWAIPEYCDFSGRAIYMDADVVILSDLAALWNHPIEGQSIVAAKTIADMTRLCTCVWDCDNAKSTILPVEQLRKDANSHQKMMDLLKQNPQLVEPYQDSYNCVDGEALAIEDIKILHYSDMGTQFSHKYALARVSAEGSEHWFDGKIMPHPRQELVELFDSYYNEALAAGYKLDNYRINAFGQFPKKTHKRYKGNKITRPSSSKSFLSRLFKR